MFCDRCINANSNCTIQNGKRLWSLSKVMRSISICQVCKQFTDAGFMADSDLDSGCLLNKKIRNAQLAQYNFILGEKLVFFEHWLSIDWTAF